MNKLTYSNDTDKALQLSLTQKLNHYFRDRSRKGNTQYILKVVFFIALSLSCYAAMLLISLPFWSLILIASLMGWAMAGLLLALAHDASHNACSKFPAINRLLSYTWDICGISHYVWELKHNQAHHAYTNIPEWDWDLSTTPLIRFSSHSPKKWFHAYQHLYASLLYSLLAVFTVYIRDFQFLFTAKLGNETIEKHPLSKIIPLVICKIFFFTYAFIIPFSVLEISIWQMIAIHFVMLWVAGSFSAFVLVPAHINDLCLMPTPNETQEIPHSWYKHHYQTSLDFAANSRLVNWLVGGTNTHLAHHLFPGICHIHYFEMTKILQEVAREHQLPYQNLSIWELYKSHFRHLKKLGQQ